MPKPLQRRMTMGGGQLVTLPQNLQSTQHTLIEDFEVLTDFTVEASSVGADDTTHFVHSSQSIQLTTPTAAQGYINKVFSPTLAFNNTSCVRYYYYVADKTLMTAGALLLSHSASNYTNGFQATFGMGSVRNGWNVRNIPKADFSTMGAGDWANPIAQARWRATGAGGVKGVLSWDMMTGGVLGTPVVCIMFDDEYTSVHTLAFPYMKAHNIRGTMYTISNSIGAGGRMTAAQLQELYINGWDIANHTADHVDLTTLSQANAQIDIATCKTVLDGYGWTRGSSHLAYPQGAYNSTVKAACVAEGVLTARPTSEGGSGYEILPFEDILAVNPYNSLKSTLSLATMITQVDTTVSKGGILIIYGHEIVAAGAAGEQWNVADFLALIDYILVYNLPCVTISELYRLLSGPVRVPKVR
jgi:peptidoglycan/xylan/chitin deacetylase (PgdA/CDA1 family)